MREDDLRPEDDLKALRVRKLGPGRKRFGSVFPSEPACLTTEGLAAAAKALATRDPDLARIYEIHGTPPMWARRPGFSTLLRIVLEQQVSLVSARAMFERLKSNLDPFTPERFIESGEAYLRSLGVTRQKAHYCICVADAFQNGDLKNVAGMNDEA